MEHHLTLRRWHFPAPSPLPPHRRQRGLHTKIGHQGSLRLLVTSRARLCREGRARNFTPLACGDTDHALSCLASPGASLASPSPGSGGALPWRERGCIPHMNAQARLYTTSQLRLYFPPVAKCCCRTSRGLVSSGGPSPRPF